MASSGDATALIDFELDRFEWSGPDRLDVGGRWSGLGDAVLGVPELIVELKDRAVRLTPTPPVSSTPGPAGEWGATFMWPERRPMQLGAARLEFPDGMVVDLPAASSGRLRFARRRFARVYRAPGALDEPDVAPPTDPVLPAVPITEPNGTPAAQAAPEPLPHQPPPREESREEPRAEAQPEEAAEAEPEPAPPAAAPEPGPEADTPAPSAESAPDTLAAHFEVVAAREELHAAREALDGAREDAERLRGDLARAGERREEDRRRFLTELERAREVAVEALRGERETAAETLAAAHAELDGARDAARRLEEERAQARQALAQAAAELADERQETARLRDELDEAEERVGEAERVRHELAAAQAEREVAQAGELATAQTALEASEQRERRVRQRLEALRKGIEEALAGE